MKYIEAKRFDSCPLAQSTDGTDGDAAQLMTSGGRAPRHEASNVRVNSRGGLSIVATDLVKSHDVRKLLDEMEKLPVGQALDPR